MHNLQGKNIVLGVCGGISAYKTVSLARDLQQLGAKVQVVMTESAQSFIGTQTFQAVTGQPVWVHTNDSSFEQSMAHIDLSRWADYILIAPATANFMAKLTHGLGDDLLSVLCLMAQTPVILCPAMNVNMWQNPATVDNVNILKRRGIYLIGPDAGIQVCGDEGLGRMREPKWIIHALSLLPIYNILTDVSFVMTAGPTREAIDPVRFISNRSSGWMGYALAEALAFAGAKVTLISGPCSLDCPPQVKCISVESAEEMYEAVLAAVQPTDCFIGVAAVSDYKPTTFSKQKIKKSAQGQVQLELEQGVDILRMVKQKSLAKKVIGFAAETENLMEYARLKLAQKADMIIANQVGEKLGFEQKDISVTVLTPTKEIKLDCTDKLLIARQLVEMIKEFLE